MFRELIRNLMKGIRPLLLGLALSVGVVTPAPATISRLHDRGTLEWRFDGDASRARRSIDLSHLVEHAPLPEAPILMYHRVGRDEDRFTVSPVRLWEHLDHLRTRGYELVTFDEYTRGAHHARRPAVITFDDGTEDQYRILSDGRLDPASGLGVLERYKERHPEYRVTATFFVNMTTQRNLPVFEQPGLEREKLSFLVEQGYEIGAHGDKHRDFRKLTTEQARDDLERFLARTGDLVQGYKVRSFAYPYGSIPSDEIQRVVESYFPSTAHAWGGIADGKRVNIARIETGPRTKLAHYTSPHLLPQPRVPSIAEETPHTASVLSNGSLDGYARQTPKIAFKSSPPSPAHVPEPLEPVPTTVAAHATQHPVALLPSHHPVCSALERTVIDAPPLRDLPDVLPPRTEPPIYTRSQMMRDLGRIIEKTIALITDVRAYISVRYRGA